MSHYVSIHYFGYHNNTQNYFATKNLRKYYNILKDNTYNFKSSAVQSNYMHKEHSSIFTRFQKKNAHLHSIGLSQKENSWMLSALQAITIQTPEICQFYTVTMLAKLVIRYFYHIYFFFFFKAMSKWRHHLPNFLHKWWSEAELLFKTAYNIYMSWKSSSKMERGQTTAFTVLWSPLGCAGISGKLHSKPKGILNSMALSSKLSKILIDHFVFKSLQYSEHCKICKLIFLITFFFFFTAFIFHSVKISLWKLDAR